MNKFAIIVFTFFVSPFAYANGVSIEKLVDVLANESIQGVIEYSKNYVTKRDARNYISISNTISQQGTGKKINARWQYVHSPDKNSIDVYLPIDYYTVDVDQALARYSMKECPYNGASSGEKYIDFENGTQVHYFWSCGSMGCSYAFKFTEIELPCR
jgi:hypothetical protein